MEISIIQALPYYKPASGGNDFAYGNLGYNIAALAMERSQDKNWKSIIADEVFIPLGMKSTTAFVSAVDPLRLAIPYQMEPEGFQRINFGKADGNMQAAGGHLSTITDLARYLIAQLNSGSIEGKQAIAPQTIALTHSFQVSQNRNYGPFHRHGWGLGFDIGSYDNEILLHRFGAFGGFHSHMSLMPGHGIGVVVQVNESSTGSILANAVATAIYDVMLAKPELEMRLEQAKAALISEKEAATMAISADREQRYNYALENYTGTFANELFGTIQWRVENDKLWAKMGVAESVAEVFDSNSDQLRVELFGSGSVVQFNFENGVAKSIVLAGVEYTRI